MKNNKVRLPNMYRTIGQKRTYNPRHKLQKKRLLTAIIFVVCLVIIKLRAAGIFLLRDRPLADSGASVRPRGRARPSYEAGGRLFMEKLSYSLTIRMTQREYERLDVLMQQVGADRSSITRLALKRLFRKPPQRRFRFRPKRGTWI